jgi:rSAM-associated Gly-rich repeat protein
MTQDRRSLRALSALLPAGVLSLSLGLASADGLAAPPSGARAAKDPGSVEARLLAIRNSVSVLVDLNTQNGSASSNDVRPQLAWWGNGGWRNGGGWHNGGWGNGGAAAGWHNGGWGNGGGWHNGFRNW